MDRRGFFKQMLGKGAEVGARKVDAVIIPFERAAEAAKAAMPDDVFEEAFAPVDDALAPLEDAIATGAAATSARRPLPASPVSDLCSLDDVMRIAADCGLVRHVEALSVLARRSVRLVPADADPDSVAAPAARSRFGGAPDLPADVAWPQWRDQPLTFLAQLDLAEIAAAGWEDANPLPTDGLLLVFGVVDTAPPGYKPAHFGSSRVLLVDAAASRAAAANALTQPAGPSLPVAPTPLSLSVEWAIPHARSPQVRALGLDELERGAWQGARRQLAEYQGVELEGGDDLHAVHRLLGDPDEFAGQMPLACEFAARGHGVEPADRAEHEQIDEYRARARRWRLLLQLTIDDQLGWSWNVGSERLYLWIDEQDLATGFLSSVRALTQ